MSHDHTHAPTATEGGGTKGMVGLAIILIAVFIAVVFGYRTRDKTDEQTQTSSTTTRVAPCETYTTPVTLDFHWEVNIQSNKPVRIKLPEVDSPVDWIPNKGFTQFPRPGMGPRTFWDPADSLGGHIPFQLCRVQ